MNNKTVTVSRLKYALSYVSAQIEVKELIHHYRDTEKFIAYCKECNRYNACWACPPFDFDTTKRLMNYKQACIIGTKITLDNTLLNECTEVQQCKEASYQIIREVRHNIDRKLLALEQRYSGSLVFFAGTCHLCTQGECMRIFGKACLHPDKIRPSLEAFGFDIGKISLQLLNIELKWSKEKCLPEYFVLVSGLLTNENIRWYNLRQRND